MEILKHECGVAMIRLLKPLEYYKKKYGTWSYALNKLYLLMEKQHNRGQEGAGVGVVKMLSTPGNEFVYRERELGSNAINDIFEAIGSKLNKLELDKKDAEWVEKFAPFIGEIYMGHLRYSTTGKSGISYCHPFLRRNNWKARNLLLCGNFNMTNVNEILSKVVEQGQHPRISSDTVIILEQIGEALDREHHRVYREFRDKLSGSELTLAIEDNIDTKRILENTAPDWDGGFVICGATGSGDCFALRDSKGIRPAFYYVDDEVVVLTSERPVIQTVFNVPRKDIKELTPGSALFVSKKGEVRVSDVLGYKENQRCSFERIYFSRGSDADIYAERKSLGINIVERLIKRIGPDWDKAIYSFIPNTAEVAYIGMIQELNRQYNKKKEESMLELQAKGELTPEAMSEIVNKSLRIEKVAWKDIKLRTFITEGDKRNNLASHVYDVTYGLVKNNQDTIVAIDDSIVRGTTLKESILSMLDKLHPKKIVVVSSSPQVRYPDCYGIDMSRMNEFIAFKGAVALLRERGMEDLLEKTYRDCLAQEELPDDEIRNCVKQIYEPFTQEEISRKIVELLTADGKINAEVDIVYQTPEGMHAAIPDNPGDWYFSGNYPTPGGTKLCNRTFINFYEGNPMARVSI